MKKLYSTIMMLAMMVAALSLTACGGDDDEENGGDGGGGSASSTFTITIDGNKREMSQEVWDRLGTWEVRTLLIGTTIGDFRFKFPSGTTFSSFNSGYNSFDNDAEEITIGITSPRPCTYASGSATVISNDGKNMKVRFSNYTFTWNTSREIIFDGTLNIFFVR